MKSSGFEKADGEIIIIQDAGLKYLPKDYPQLLEPILDGRADAIYGSRFLDEPHRVLFFWHCIGNKSLTLLSKMFTNLNLNSRVKLLVTSNTFTKSLFHIAAETIRKKKNTGKMALRRYGLFSVSVSSANSSWRAINLTPNV